MCGKINFIINLANKFIKYFILYYAILFLKVQSTDIKSEELSWREYEIYKIQSSIYFANSEKLKKLLDKVLEPKVKEEETTSEKLTTQRQNSLKANKSFNGIKKLIVNNNSNNNENALTTTSTSSNQQSDDEANENLILDFAGVNHIDSDGVRMLKELITDFNSKGIKMHICQFQGKHLQFKKLTKNV